jgi:hypothetical protein
MPETHDVCYVNDQGEVVCPTAELITPAYETLRTDIETAFPEVGPNRIELIIRLLGQVIDSPLDDECIGTRTPDTVASVNRILAEQPPVMLLYRYFRLPADILSAYYYEQAKYSAAFDAQTRWSTVKPAWR